MGNFIAAEVERVIIKIEGVGEVHVELVYDPPWSMDMVTKEGREMLGWR
jgi:metal-sulfur cluster biosynthetic enzyme